MSAAASTTAVATVVAIRPDLHSGADAAATPAQPRLRLTRRGRVVLTILAAAPLVIIAAMLGLQSGGAVANDSGSSVVFDTETVLPGESLWSIAERVAPGTDPRDVVYELVALNGLQNSQVHPGQQIAIPLAYSR